MELGSIFIVVSIVGQKKWKRKYIFDNFLSCIFSNFLVHHLKFVFVFCPWKNEKWPSKVSYFSYNCKNVSTALKSPICPDTHLSFLEHWPLYQQNLWSLKSEIPLLYTPGPHIMRIHLVQNSTSARFEKNPLIFT